MKGFIIGAVVYAGLAVLATQVQADCIEEMSDLVEVTTDPDPATKAGTTLGLMIGISRTSEAPDVQTFLVDLLAETQTEEGVDPDLWVGRIVEICERGIGE